MNRAFTLIEVVVCIAILFIIGAITASVIVGTSHLTQIKANGVGDELTIGNNYLKVREWIDAKTGKRYLVFDRFNGGLFAIEAPLTVESK